MLLGLEPQEHSQAALADVVGRNGDLPGGGGRGTLKFGE